MRCMGRKKTVTLIGFPSTRITSGRSTLIQMPKCSLFFFDNGYYRARVLLKESSKKHMEWVPTILGTAFCWRSRAIKRYNFSMTRYRIFPLYTKRCFNIYNVWTALRMNVQMTLCPHLVKSLNFQNQANDLSVSLYFIAPTEHLRILVSC